MLMRSYLQGLVVSLQLPTQTLQLAASQDGLAVISLQVDLLLHDLRLLLLKHLQPLLHGATLFQLWTTPACTEKQFFYWAQSGPKRDLLQGW